MFTKEQEDYLKKIADQGIEEEREAIARNLEIERNIKVELARANKKAELEAEAKELVDRGLEDFETNEAPLIEA